MALILARGGRRDRFGHARVEFDELPSATAAALTQIVSAGLRRRLLTAGDRQAADRQLASASAALLRRHDPSKRLEALAAVLIRLLDEQGRLNEDLIAAAAEDGEVVLVAQALARRAAIGGDEAFDLLLGGEGASLRLVAAQRPGTWVDRLLTTAATAGIAIPNFWLGMMLIAVFAVNLGWLPGPGGVDLADDPGNALRALVLPSIALGMVGSAEICRQVRSAMTESLSPSAERSSAPCPK
jgi:hypothetical protein